MDADKFNSRMDVSSHNNDDEFFGELAPLNNNMSAGTIGTIESSDQNQFSTHESKRGIFASSIRAQSNWAKAVKNARVSHQATKIISAENKVGTQAQELDDDDVLKVISLSLHRSLRAFGELSNPSASTKITPQAEQASEYKKLDPHSLHFQKVNDKSMYEVHQPNFVCRDLFSENFTEIRKNFKLSDTTFYSITGLQKGRKESDYYVISSKDASGKSVSFFLLSPDQRIIFKLCTNADMKSINNIVGKYQNYVKDCIDETGKNRTLLPRFLGIYSLEFEDSNIPDVVLMAQKNFFAATHKIHKKYDLKGSTHNRFASKKERAKKSPCFKDLDWLDANERLRFPSDRQKEDIKAQINKDSLFLSSNNLIDYSLLVGVHNCDTTKPQLYLNKKDVFVSTIAPKSEDGTIKYYGIVDILTPYTKRKIAETIFTGTLMCGRDVSCQPPSTYQKRFVKFFSEQILE